MLAGCTGILMADGYGADPVGANRRRRIGWLLGAAPSASSRALAGDRRRDPHVGPGPTGATGEQLRQGPRLSAWAVARAHALFSTTRASPSITIGPNAG